jgi:ATP-dependent DNA ligase
MLPTDPAAKLRASSGVLDGEAICCDDSGVADFEGLHRRAHDGSADLNRRRPYDWLLVSSDAT